MVVAYHLGGLLQAWVGVAGFVGIEKFRKHIAAILVTGRIENY